MNTRRAWEDAKAEQKRYAFSLLTCDWVLSLQGLCHQGGADCRARAPCHMEGALACRAAYNHCCGGPPHAHQVNAAIAAQQAQAWRHWKCFSLRTCGWPLAGLSYVGLRAGEFTHGAVALQEYAYGRLENTSGMPRSKHTCALVVCALCASSDACMPLPDLLS